MSASERLRALEAAASPGPWVYTPEEYDGIGARKEDAEFVSVIRDALPLIVDVVEAAEDTFDEYPDRFAALTALREHLEGAVTAPRPLRDITAALKVEIGNGDIEIAHLNADDLLIEAIQRLASYATDTEDEGEVEALIASWDEVEKWHA